MEINKLDTLSRVSKEMKKVMDLEATMMEEENDVTCIRDRAYERQRDFFNQGGPVMEKTMYHRVPMVDKEIPLVFHYPKVQENMKAIVFIHGGGFTVGSNITHDGIMRRLADVTKSVVIGIEYSLAPDHKFPIPLLECMEVVRYLHAHRDTYGIRGDHISLAGDSAGAYLSLATAVAMRDTEDPVKIKALLLFYGGFGLEDSKSMRLFGGDFDGLTLKNLKDYHNLFTREKDQNHPHRNLFNSDLTHGIPPTFILACQLDPLKDDSKLLYEIFKEHGIETKYKEVEGVIHGFLHYGNHMHAVKEAFRVASEFYESLDE